MKGGVDLDGFLASVIAGSVKNNDSVGTPVWIFGIELEDKPIEKSAKGSSVRIGLTDGEIASANCVDTNEDAQPVPQRPRHLP